MENKVGHKVPTAKDIQQVAEQLDAVTKQLRAWCINLPADERSGGARFRQGGPAMARLLTEIATRHGVELKGSSLDELANDLAVMTAARQLQGQATQLTQLLDDTANEAEREASDAFHRDYSRLSNLAESDPALATEIAPLVDHLTPVRRRKKDT